MTYVPIGRRDYDRNKNGTKAHEYVGYVQQLKLAYITDIINLHNTHRTKKNVIALINVKRQLCLLLTHKIQTD